MTCKIQDLSDYYDETFIGYQLDSWTPLMSVVYFCVTRIHFIPYAITLFLIAISITGDSLPKHLYCVLSNAPYQLRLLHKIYNIVRLCFTDKHISRPN